MRKILKVVILLIAIVIMPISVYAHPGGLDSSGCHYCRTNCAKWGLDVNEYHCHSGNTYSNSKGEIYDKSGTRISGGNVSNNNSTENNENDNINNSMREKSSNNNSVSSNNSTYNTKTEASITKPVETKAVEKKKDASLKIVKIDNNDILIKEHMTYETSKKNIELNIEATDSKAKVEFNNQELEFGENEIIIKVTAEAGISKEYKLVVTKKEIQSTVIIKEFILGSSEVDFENNKATIEKLTNESSFDYSYELSDKNAKLLLYINEKEVTKFNNIKNKDIIKLVVVDVDDNKNVYEIEVTEASKVKSAIINAIAYTIVIGVFLSPAIVIGVIIYIKKKKKIR